MKKVTLRQKLSLSLAVLCGNVTAAWAADTARVDNSDLFVWIFLAFCGLIVVAQLIPAIMMMLGVAKSVKNKIPEPAPVTEDQEPIQGA